MSDRPDRICYKTFLATTRNVKYHNIFPPFYQLNAVYVSVVFLGFPTPTDIHYKLIKNKDFAN